MSQPNNHMDIPQQLKNQRTYKFSFQTYNAKKYLQKQAYLKSQLRFRVKVFTGAMILGIAVTQLYRLYKYIQYDIDIASGKVSEYVLDRFR